MSKKNHCRGHFVFYLDHDFNGEPIKIDFIKNPGIAGNQAGEALRNSLIEGINVQKDKIEYFVDVDPPEKLSKRIKDLIKDFRHPWGVVKKNLQDGKQCKK